MNDWCEASYSIPPMACSTEILGMGYEAESPWLLASQIRDLLGEEGELYPGILEESWTSGLPVRLKAFRVGRTDRPASNVGSVTVAQLDGFGSFFFEQSSVRTEKQFPSPDFKSTSSSYTAQWLRDPLDQVPSATAERAQDDRSEGGESGHRADAGRLRAMTRQGACELLGVSEGSSETQVKAAYRRMVGAWHPDRLEQREESVRAFATAQMAAINQAYHFLRASRSGGVL